MSEDETLREAARLMRERAQAATGVTHRWSRGLAGKTPSPVVLCGMVRIAQTDETLTGPPSNAEHIASWHPAVALAVAKLLDTLAMFPSQADPTDMHAALDLARAYLGGDA